MWDQLLQWDQQTLIFLNNLGSDTFDLFWIITTNFLTWIPLFLFIIIHIIRCYSKKELKWVLCAFLSMLLFLTIAIFLCKYAVGRLRPINDITINPLLRTLITPSDYSFFSGHAASSFGIITLAFLFLKKRMAHTYLLFLWPLFFSFSRLYLGVHYPLDILAGSITGVFFAWVFYKMHQRFSAPYIL